MKHFITIFIFCVVLFLYLHIHHQLKTSNDLEVYTIERPSKNKLEEICDLRQPVVFEFSNERLLESCNLANLDDNYGAFDIKLRDIQNNDENSELFLPFLLKEALKLFQNDKDSKYITENNADFLEETAAVKNFRYNDSFLRPPMVSKCIYDIWSGSIGAQTPLRYNLEYRTFLYITSGKAKLKLIPPHSARYLNTEKDYDNFEFRSPVNPWNVQEEYKHDFNKIKCIEVKLEKGKLLFIPAYWWNSIKFNTKDTVILSFKYRTYMNNIAILPEYFKYLLQKQNIKHNVIKRLNTD